MFGTSSFSGYSHLYDITDDDGRDALDDQAVMFDECGIDIGDYCYGIETDAYDARLIYDASREIASANAANILLARAIMRDRAFCLRMYSEDTQA